jgi:hypothetical protein
MRLVNGRLQNDKIVRHVIVRKAINTTPLTTRLTPESQADLNLNLSRADERDGTPFPDSLKNPGTVLPEARNFR